MDDFHHPNGNLAGRVANTGQTWATPVDYDEVVVVDHLATVAVIGQSPLAVCVGAVPHSFTNADFWVRMLFQQAVPGPDRNDQFIALTDGGVSGFFGISNVSGGVNTHFEAGNIGTDSIAVDMPLPSPAAVHELVGEFHGGGGAARLYLDGDLIVSGACPAVDPAWIDFGPFLDNEFGATTAGGLHLVAIGAGRYFS